MCGCNKKNNVGLQPKKRLDFKIYLNMAQYEVKKEWLGKGLATTFAGEDGDNLIIGWDNASKKDLARAYEEFNGADRFINKTENSSKDKGKD